MDLYLLYHKYTVKFAYIIHVVAIGQLVAYE